MAIGARTRSRGRARGGELWTPQAIDYRLLSWLSSKDPRNVDDTGAVGTWIDRSSSGKDATQSTADNKPSWSATAMDGHPGLVFGGDTPANGGDWLEFDGKPFYDAGSTAGAMFLVVKLENYPPESVQETGAIISHIGSGLTKPVHHPYTNGNMYDLFFVHDRISFTPSSDLDIPTLCAATHDGTTMKWYINCVEDFSKTVGVSLYSGSTFNYAIGRSLTRDYMLNGVISEIVLIDGAVDDRLRYIIEGYLAHAYGNAWRISDSHPFKNRPPLLSDM